MWDSQVDFLRKETKTEKKTKPRQEKEERRQPHITITPNPKWPKWQKMQFFMLKDN